MPLTNEKKKTDKKRGALGAPTGTALNRQEPAPLYRGDSRPPNEIYKKGFKALGTNKDLVDHILHCGGEKGTKYVSTSISKEKAKKHPKYVSKSYVYEIRTMRPVVNVEEFIKNYLDKFGDLKGAAQFYAKTEREIAIKGKISPFEIKKCWKVSKIDKKRVISTEFVLNPEYYEHVIQKVRFSVKTISATVVAIEVGIDINELYQEYSISKKIGNFSNTYQVGIQLAGKWIGGFTLGLLGARCGASIGSLAGSYGIIGGSILGGAGGFFYGAMGGSALGEEIYQKLNSPERTRSSAPSTILPSSVFEETRARLNSLDTSISMNSHVRINEQSQLATPDIVLSDAEMFRGRRSLDLLNNAAKRMAEMPSVPSRPCNPTTASALVSNQSRASRGADRQSTRLSHRTRVSSMNSLSESIESLSTIDYTITPTSLNPASRFISKNGESRHSFFNNATAKSLYVPAEFDTILSERLNVGINPDANANGERAFGGAIGSGTCCTRDGSSVSTAGGDVSFGR